MKKLKNIVIFILLVLALGIVGKSDYEQEKKDSQRYLQIYGYDYTLN